MEVAKAIRALSRWNCHPNPPTDSARPDLAVTEIIVAVPVRHPANSDFLAEWVCRKRTTAPRVKSSGGPQSTCSECGVVNQTDEKVELMSRGLEPAADSVQGKEKSAIEHGFENAIEGTSPLQ